jgi:hypothetical protein
LIHEAVFGKKNAQRAHAPSASADFADGAFLRSQPDGQHDRVEQLRLLDGLREVGGDTEMLAARNIAGSVARGEHHHDRARQVRIAPDSLHQLETVDRWHVGVGDDELERASLAKRLPEARQGGFRAGGRVDGQIPPLQHFLENQPVGRVVVDHEGPHAAQSRGVRGGQRCGHLARSTESCREMERAPHADAALHPDAPSQ